MLNLIVDSITRALQRVSAIPNEAACLRAQVRLYVAKSAGEVEVNFRFVTTARCYHVDYYIRKTSECLSASHFPKEP